MIAPSPPPPPLPPPVSPPGEPPYNGGYGGTPYPPNPSPPPPPPSPPAAPDREWVESGSFPVDNDDTRAVALGDVDGDGDLDVVVGNYLSPNQLLVNEVVDAASAWNWTNQSLEEACTGGCATVSVAVGDVDGDGDLDMLEGNIQVGDGVSSTSNQAQLRHNNGTHLVCHNNFLGGTQRDTSAIAFLTFDGDGMLDVVIGRMQSSEQNVEVLVQTGGASFASITPWKDSASLNSGTTAVAAGDLDGDGLTDLVVAYGSGSAPQMLRNLGGGVLEAHTFDWGEASRGYDAVALGDIDGDGDLDVVFGGSGIWLILNDAQQVLNGGQNWDAQNFRDNWCTGWRCYSTHAWNLLPQDSGSTSFDYPTGQECVRGFPTSNDFTTQYSCSSTSGTCCADYAVKAIALGDLDNDGDLDIVVGGGDKGPAIMPLINPVINRPTEQGRMTSQGCFPSCWARIELYQPTTCIGDASQHIGDASQQMASSDVMNLVLGDVDLECAAAPHAQARCP